MCVALALSVLTLSAVSGCVPTGASESDPRLGGTWFLASGSDNGHDLAVGAQVISLTITDSAHTGGDEPCSTYSATVTGGIGVVYVRPRNTSGTRDSCETSALDKLQQLYFTALGASQFATIDQGALVLTSPQIEPRVPARGAGGRRRHPQHELAALRGRIAGAERDAPARRSTRASQIHGRKRAEVEFDRACQWRRTTSSKAKTLRSATSRLDAHSTKCHPTRTANWPARRSCCSTRPLLLNVSSDGNNVFP